MATEPMPTVTYRDKVYKLRSRAVTVPDLETMPPTGALAWLIRNTYPRGTNHRRPAPNLAGCRLEVR